MPQLIAFKLIAKFLLYEALNGNASKTYKVLNILRQGHGPLYVVYSNQIVIYNKYTMILRIF